MSVHSWKKTGWHLIGAAIFRRSPHTAHALRRRVLRFFGSSIGGCAKIRRSVKIDCPWNLTMGELAIIGDHAIINCTSPVTLGARSVVSQLAVITTRMRDPIGSMHTVIDAPVIVEDDAWVAADALVLPGVTISRGTVVGARGLVEQHTKTTPWHICVGQPVRAIKERAYFARTPNTDRGVR